MKAPDATAAAWQWFKNESPIENANANKITVTEPGVYRVITYNRASCASPPSDPVEIKLTPGAADLSLQKRAEDKQVGVGEPFDYLLEVQNKGPHTASNIRLEDSLPNDLDFLRVAGVTQGKVVFEGASNTVIWNAGALDSGAVAQLRIEVKANRSGNVVNTARVTASERDNYLHNNVGINEKKILGLKIPNVFTPNGDGMNDTFEIENLLEFPDNDIVILNRWGNSVYEKRNYQNTWTAEGLVEGTYFYVLKVRNTKGQQDIYKGYVTVLRDTKK
ncbi:gliding motility-associated C-terminal domain-containing protein [Arcticibacter sp. MXS-1]|uniref:T9SS type B sorting domain-containing protein n=1 Tax=Arcticibacter sp. MXS-1 TaxID=3341726 RepID=UPI0035A87A9C